MRTKHSQPSSSRLSLGSGSPLLAKGTIQLIPIDSIAIDPSNNPRRRLAGIDALAASIREHGLLQPLLVRQHPDEQGHYYLVAGHRRMAALQMLAQSHPRGEPIRVPVVLREEATEEAYVLTLVENLQRDDLSPKDRRPWPAHS